jgi:PAS domain S-box-containing protein
MSPQIEKGDDATDSTRALSPIRQPLFQSLIEHSVDAIALVDGQGKVLYISPSIQRLLGYTPEELLGRVAFEFIHPDDQEKTMAVLGAVVQQPGASLMVEYRLRHRDGSWRWMEATATNMLHDPQIGAIIGNFHDITERKQAEEALRASEAKFRKFFDSHIIGAFVSTLDGLYLEANDVLLDMLGYTREDLLAGKVHRDTLTAPAYEYVSQQAVRELRETGFTRPYEKEYLRKDGTPLPILVAITRIDPERDTCMGFVLDRSEAKALEKRRDEFISMASHELKTPVTSLIGYTQLLRNRFQKRGDEDSVYLLSRMDVQLHRLTKLINDLLDVSRAQSGQLAYHEEHFDLLPLVQEVVGNMQEVTKSHRLILEGQASAPVFGDRERLGQVLTNLLINAIKYSPRADQVYIRIVTEQARVIVSVQDFGIGIADAHQEHLFERFYRASDAEINTYPGLGIGLYISREIIIRHHGDIWFESHKGAGSTFSFALPLCEAKVDDR